MVIVRSSVGNSGIPESLSRVAFLFSLLPASRNEIVVLLAAYLANLMEGHPLIHVNARVSVLRQCLSSPINHENARVSFFILGDRSNRNSMLEFPSKEYNRGINGFSSARVEWKRGEDRQIMACVKAQRAYLCRRI